MMNILLANEPRFYREVLATAFQGLRPCIEAHAIEPEKLGREALSARPDLVICDHITPELKASVRFWIEYRVEKDALIVTATNVDGLALGADDTDLEGLLSIVDRLEELTTSNDGVRRGQGNVGGFNR